MNQMRIDDLLPRYGMGWHDFELLTQRHGFPNLCAKHGEIVCDSGEFARWITEIKILSGAEGCEQCE